MDNRVFNVNGGNEGMLLRTLQLAFDQRGAKACNAFAFSTEHGLVLLWHYDVQWAHTRPHIRRAPAPLSVDTTFNIVRDWLKSSEAKSTILTDWDANVDHDGDNSPGWRVYTGDWGHVGEYRDAICAIKPAFMWHGK